MDFTLNQTWPTFYDHIPVYKISIQYTNPFKCIKFQSNTPILSKDITRKPFVLCTGQTDGTGWTDGRTDSSHTICTPWWAHKKSLLILFSFKNSPSLEIKTWTLFVIMVFQRDPTCILPFCHFFIHFLFIKAQVDLFLLKITFRIC